jgi:hypothetical protein
MLSSCSRAACATYGPNWVYRVRVGGNVSSLTAAARGGRARTRCGAGAGLAAVTRTITEYQHGRLSDDAAIVLIEWMPLTPPVRDHSLPPEVSGGQQSQPGQAGTKRKAPSRWGTPCGLQKSTGAGA